MPSILIVEDEQMIRRALRQILENSGFRVDEALSVADAQEHYTLHTFDLVISELRLPGPPATELLPHIQAPLLLITRYAGIPDALQAIQLGATDFIPKPFNQKEILHTLRRVLDRHNRAEDLTTEIFSHSPVMGRILTDFQSLAQSTAPVLICGATGTGKELLARTLHRGGPQSDGPFIPVNCAAIPGHLIEGELFGQGPLFPDDARPPQEGLVGIANGGSLFLDEITELPIEAQQRLLAVLRSAELYRPGTPEAQKINVRLLATTQRDLRQQVSEGQFDGELYQWLQPHRLDLPPLHERGEDIIPLATKLLDKACRRLHRLPMVFTPSALEAIQDYPWPGNIRELENAVERAVILNPGDTIGAELLALHPESPKPGDPGEAPANMSLDDYFLYFVLSNQDKLSETEMARRLGISRKSLWERRQRLGIPKPRGKRRSTGLDE